MIILSASVILSPRLANEGFTSGVDRALAQFFFDTHQLVVFLNSLATSRRACFEMAGAHRHCEVSDKAVRRFTAAVGDHRAPACLSGHLDRCDRLAQSTNLVELDQHRIGNLLFDAALDALDIGDKQVVADQLYSVAQGLVEQFPSLPVILSQTILQDDDGVFANPIGVHLHHFLR